MDTTTTSRSSRPMPSPIRESWRAPLTRGDSTVSARDSTYWLSVASSSTAASSAAWSFTSTPLSVAMLPEPSRTNTNTVASTDAVRPTVHASSSPVRPELLPSDKKTRFSLCTSPLKCSDVGGYVNPFELALSSPSLSSPLPTPLVSVCTALDSNDVESVRTAATTTKAGPIRSNSSEPLRVSATAATNATTVPTVPTAPTASAVPTDKRHSSSVVAVEEVFENQRYQIVLGWGAKGHLLPLDPGKYMRAIRRPRRGGTAMTDTSVDATAAGATRTATRRRRSIGDFVFGSPRPATERRSDPSSDDSDVLVLNSYNDDDSSRDDHDVDIEWVHSPVFPDIALPECSDSTQQRWEWISPWHLECAPEVSTPSVSSVSTTGTTTVQRDPDGWQYAASFQHFPLANSTAGDDARSLRVALTWRPKLYVRRRKWVRYRRLQQLALDDTTTNSVSGSVSGLVSAVDDTFLDTTSGWLRKRGHVRKSWKARYFVLERSVLRYYADAARTRLKGEVLLFHAATRVQSVDVHVAGGRDYAFAVHVGANYALLLQAETVRERERWLFCIEDALLCRDSYRHESVAATVGPSRSDNTSPVLSSTSDDDVRAGIALRRKLSAESLVFAAGAVDNDLLALVDSTQTLRQVVGSAHSTVARLLAECDAVLAASPLQQRIQTFIQSFRAQYPVDATTAAAAGESCRRRSRGASVSDAVSPSLSPSSQSPSSLQTAPAATVGDSAVEPLAARSALALESYRTFVEHTLASVLQQLAQLPIATGSPVTSPRGWNASAKAQSRAAQPQQRRQSTSERPVRVTEDEWHLVRRAALAKLERLVFVPLHASLYGVVEAALSAHELAAFERSRAFVAAQPPAFLDIAPALTSHTRWRRATALLDTLDTYSLPSEKAAALLEVARCIYDTTVREQQQQAPTMPTPTMLAADDFLPIFIYVVARCRLRNVVVTRRIVSETLVAALLGGETGYYATMLEAAVGYIASFDVDAEVHAASDLAATAH